MPDEGELKVKELALYRAYYCGLCKTIGERYGQTARLFLSYDCAFLALLLSGLTEAPPCTEQGCFKHLHPKRSVAVPQPALDYAAAVNVLLAKERARDELHDEKTVRSAAALAALYRAGKKAASEYPGLSAAIASQLGRLAEAERAGETCTDVPADAFGTLMREIIRNAPEVTDDARPALEWMFYNLGRWIYLIDAWDDREKDAKNGNYNPFLAAKLSGEDASYLIGMSLAESVKGYDLVPVKTHGGPLDNIMHEGLQRKTRLVLEGTEE